MIIVLGPGTTKDAIEYITKKIEDAGLKPLVSSGVERTVINVIGDERILDKNQFEAIPCVEKIIPILKPYKFASREFKQENTVIKVDGVEIGGNKIVIIAGPCSVEGKEQIIEIAKAVKEKGAGMLRGGAFKPRTSPYAFQGLEEEGLKHLKEAKKEIGLPIVSELMDTKDIELLLEYVDVIQIGARNMQNFSLLKEIGKINKPILLKRGMSATINEFLMAAEYILAGGNQQIILCERGIRTFIDHSRNTLDISGIAVLKELTHLPVISDPSHAGGKAKLVTPLALASIAVGCDGLLVEVHQDPERAFSDGEQSLNLDAFGKLMDEAGKVAEALGRTI
ncbi:TPA: 3-deoxy-7-phosphoheptulonate synthase [bacterium]|nr:3-deoxy-7-phosphoheptulonate synthase [bacterium]